MLIEASFNGDWCTQALHLLMNEKSYFLSDKGAKRPIIRKKGQGRKIFYPLKLEEQHL